MNYIVLDTNIFIHFKDFDQIDWMEVISKKGEFTLVIPPIVIDEIDNHKYNKNSKISRRVKRILPKIEIYLNSEEGTIKLMLISKRPNENTFLDHGLKKIDHDDCLLASILEFKNEIENDDYLVYITHDTGPRLKAKTLSIHSEKIHEKFILPDEPDDSEKRNKQLEKELSVYRNQCPKISFGFLENEKVFRPETKSTLIDEDSYLSDQLKKVKETHNYLNKVESANGIPSSIFQVSQLFALSDAQIINYNSDLDKYYDQIEEYHSSVYYRLSYEYECVEVKLKISNSGTAPANDVDVELYFPDGFTLHTKEDLPQIISKPTAPYQPKTRHDIQYRSNFFPKVGTINILPKSGINLNAPSIKKTNSYNVDFHLLKLKHNQSFEFETLYLKFENRSLAQNFSIKYRIMISNYPDVLKGSINVVMH